MQVDFSKETVAYGPATIANMGSGFDILGMALEHPADTLWLRPVPERGIRILSIEGDGGALSLLPTENVAGVVLDLFSATVGYAHGWEVKLRKGLPLGSGMGSSSASSVAALWAANVALGHPMTKLELVPLAMEGERAACGVAHADNVAPAMLGGIVLVRNYHPLDLLPLPVPVFMMVVASPKFEIRTGDARRVLPPTLPMQAVIAQMGQVASLIASLYKGDIEMLGQSLTDYIAAPYRSKLLPGYDALGERVRAAGALGFGISGSGPALFALCAHAETAQQVRQAFLDGYAEMGMECNVYVSGVNAEGVRTEAHAVPKI